jgi:hypothetical protein
LFLDEEGEWQWPAIRFQLMWLEHGGSGLHMSFSDADNLDWADIPDLSERMNEQRKREAAAIKGARNQR